MAKTRWKITTAPDDLREGLFGQVILWTFEVLPYLRAHGIYPAWDIKSKLYGAAPGYTILPGVLDLAYTPPTACDREVSLDALRDKSVSALGGDWHYLARLWQSYFVVPSRIRVAADAIALPEDALGVHYRGGDKNEALWDTNPVSQDDFLTLIKGFLKEHPELKSVFVATDEYSFVMNAKQHLGHLHFINLGAVDGHKNQTNVPERADRALLDCVLLSRCRYVLKCSSALSGFAKILNPDLELYRVSASKLFADIPYFPEAYIPRLEASDPECKAILERQFVNDWRDNARMRRKFGAPFRSLPRNSWSQKLMRALKDICARARKKVFDH